MRKANQIITFAGILSMLILLASCGMKGNQAISADTILEADRYYSSLSEKEGMNAAFIEMFDSAGVMLKENHKPILGIEAISTLLRQEEDSSFILTWEPEDAIIANSGELGYSYGTYLIRSKTTLQKIGDGTYTTIWRNTTGKGWKAVLDTGNPGLGNK
ncbi:MAG: hypothetical protein IPH88_09620 [Bacteroidales bacterium]|nr:hypothetical protein [Bacteroidales bacterium]